LPGEKKERRLRDAAEEGRKAAGWSTMIVVGVDGSPGSDAALRWALAEAKLRGVPLRAVNAYELPQLPVGGPLVGAPGVFASGATEEDLEPLRSAAVTQAERIIEDALERMGPATDRIETESAAVEGPAAETLIAAARDAELLVVGSRGHGGFVGLLLGSVSQKVVHHQPCPVVILPPPEER
jgi:nucleotide-binding universal stress UspA family protein